MAEDFAEYAITHEAGHAVVGRFVKVSSPARISFKLHRKPDGLLYLGDFATSFPFPPDEQMPGLPVEVKNCICYTLAAGYAATQFKDLSLPDEKSGLNADRTLLAKLTERPLESFVPPSLAVIRQERHALDEVISRCQGKYQQLKLECVDEGVHTLLSIEEMDSIFNKMMLASTNISTQFNEVMSAHEAGHATVGVAIGARIEAVYAVIGVRLPGGNHSISYQTKFGSLRKAGVDLEGQVLLTAGAAAAEILLNGSANPENTKADRADLEKVGVRNFEYCVSMAKEILVANNELLVGIRNLISSRMSDMRSCKLARGGSHIVLAKGSEIEKLHKLLGSPTDPLSFDMSVARQNPTADSIPGVTR